jgi:hypothetical protein
MLARNSCSSPQRHVTDQVERRFIGGSDRTRTCGLLRDSAAGLGFTITYKTCGDCQTPRKSYKTSHFVG